jgi:hypothetical protein
MVDPARSFQSVKVAQANTERSIPAASAFYSDLVVPKKEKETYLKKEQFPRDKNGLLATGCGLPRLGKGGGFAAIMDGVVEKRDSNEARLILKIKARTKPTILQPVLLQLVTGRV